MLRLFKHAVAGAATVVMLAATPAYSANREEASLSTISATSLEPGQFVWEANAPADGPVEIVVSIPLQLAYVYRGGTLIGVSTISSGAPGNDTPTGTFQILQKRRDHRSNLYNDAPMPFMQRLTWDGIALHAGEIPGHPASHGCVRLPLAFARQLFTMTRLGGSVHVVDTAFTPQEATLLLRDGQSTALASN